MDNVSMTGYVQIVPQTWQERYDMYMKHTKEELASMLAESAKIMCPQQCAELQKKVDSSVSYSSYPGGDSYSYSCSTIDPNEV